MRTTLLAASLALSLFIALGVASPTFAAAPQQQTVCRAHHPHPNWLIVAVSSTPWWDTHCDNQPFGSDNLVTIAPIPTGPVEVCALSPLPNTFVTIAQRRATNACDGRPALTIAPLPTNPSASITICASSRFPISWLTIAEHASESLLQCPLDDGGPLVTKTIQLPTGSPTQVCSDSYLPPGYIKVPSLPQQRPSVRCARDANLTYTAEPRVDGGIPHDPTQ